MILPDQVFKPLALLVVTSKVTGGYVVLHRASQMHVFGSVMPDVLLN